MHGFLKTFYLVRIGTRIGMGKAKSASNRAKDQDESIPKWAEEEIKSVQFDQPEDLTRTGYILDIYERDYKIDVQLYESLPDGRNIIEGLDVPRSMKIEEFMKGYVYEFKIKMFKGPLSERVTEFLKSKFDLEMSVIYRFELQALQLMDVESDTSQSLDNETD
jgi:hypothetical protein